MVANSYNSINGSTDPSVSSVICKSFQVGVLMERLVSRYIFSVLFTNPGETTSKKANRT